MAKTGVNIVLYPPPQCNDGEGMILPEGKLFKSTKRGKEKKEEKRKEKRREGKKRRGKIKGKKEEDKEEKIRKGRKDVKVKK